MKVKFFHTLLFAAAFVTASGAFVSCKDYESDDVQELKNLNAEQQASIAKLSQQITDLQTKVKDCPSECQTNINNLRTELQAADEANKTLFTNWYNGLSDSTKTLYSDLDALKGDLNKRDQLVNARIDSVVNVINNVKEGVLNAISQSITEVLVQGTYSPAFGSLTLPLDIQSNLLVTYYGDVNGNVTFPARGDALYEGSDNVTASELNNASPVNVSGTIIDGDGAEGNAGTLYVTVNPQEVDLTGVPFALVNSKGEKSSVSLTGASDYDGLLTWGYTRAGGNVKAIKATISKENLNNSDIKVNIKRDGLTTAVKNVITDRTQTKSNLKALARTAAKFIYDNINTTIPRLGIATEYSVKLGDATKTLHNVGSLNILAAAVKPANFASLDAISDVKTFPGLERAESTINNFISKINGNIQNVDTIKYENGKYTITSNGTVFDATQLVKDLNASLTSINTLIKDMQGKLNGSNVISYLDNANNRLAYWFNRSKNAALKPVLLIDGGNDAHRVINGGTIAAGSYNLVPTTWTYELLAPAYKKFVNVIKDGKSVEGENLGKVINGDVRSIPVTLTSGTYTIVYEAVDYAGNIIAKKYTVNVK